MPRIPDEHVGNRIRLARTTAGLDSKDLANLLDVSPSAVTSWEHVEDDRDLLNARQGRLCPGNGWRSERAPWSRMVRMANY